MRWETRSIQEQAYENRMLMRIFGHKKDNVRSDWEKQHNEELHNIYSFSYIIRMIKIIMGWECSMPGGEEECTTYIKFL
jgi:hypothetical protein